MTYANIFMTFSYFFMTFLGLLLHLLKTKHTKMEISLTKERIKDLISQKGVSYAAFAQELGIKRQNLDAYLDAQKKDINLVIKMADVLGMSLYEFIGMPEPGTKEVYGCLYVKGRPVLVNSKEDIKDLIKMIENPNIA